MMRPVSRNLGVQGTHASPPAPPPATRATAPGWRDPRMWVGVAIVAVSVVAGVRLLSSADDTVATWAVAADMGAGDVVTEDDLVARRVRFADDADLGRYFTVDDRLPDDLALIRGVGEGELLPRGAVGSAGESGTLQVRIAVDNEQVPSAVTAGSVVHVYLVPGIGDASGASGGASAGESADEDGGAGRGGGPAGEPALVAVPVVDAPPVGDNFAATGNRTIDVAISEEQAQAYFTARAALDDPVVTVVKVG